jgi:hypothetical protein
MRLTFLLFILAVSAVQIRQFTVKKKHFHHRVTCPPAQKLNTYQFTKASAGLYSIFINIYQAIVLDQNASSFIEQVRRADGQTVDVKTMNAKKPDLAEMLDLKDNNAMSDQTNQRSVNEALPAGAVILSMQIQQISGFFYYLIHYMYNSQYFHALIATGMQAGTGFRRSIPSTHLADDKNCSPSSQKADEEVCLNTVLKNMSIEQITAYGSLEEINACTKNNFVSSSAVLPTLTFFDLLRSGLCRLF